MGERRVINVHLNFIASLVQKHMFACSQTVAGTMRRIMNFIGLVSSLYKISVLSGRRWSPGSLKTRWVVGHCEDF